MVLSMILDSRLREAVEKCDRWVDPLREVMFDVIVADSVKWDWDFMIERLARARRWLDVSLETTKTIDMGEYAKVSSWLDQLADKARSKDGEGWDMLVDSIAPSLINMVFAKYAKCIADNLPRW
jgi:hypothetical protein